MHIHLTNSTRQVVCMNKSEKHMICSGHSQCAWLRWPTKTLFVMLLGHAEGFEEHLSKIFTDFDLFVMLTSCSDAKMSTSDNFSADNITDCFTICTCVWGNNYTDRPCTLLQFINRLWLTETNMHHIRKIDTNCIKATITAEITRLCITM